MDSKEAHIGAAQALDGDGAFHFDNYMKIVLISFSSLLLVSSSSAWHSMGYLSPVAWILEWGDVILAFLCLYISLRTTNVKSLSSIIFILGFSTVFSILSLLPSLNLVIPSSINSVYYFAYSIPALSAIFIFFLLKRGKKNLKIESILFLLVVEGTIMFLSYLFYTTSPVFPTDESVFNLYSAHLFLSGLNPYAPNSIANSFAYYGFSINGDSPITPLLTGGYVNSMTYPALSFLVFIPAILLQLKSGLIMLPIFSIPIFLTWYRAWKNHDYVNSTLVLLPFLILVLYTYQAGAAQTDVLWVTLLMLSYYFLPRHKISGAFYGLSLSVKQFPLLAGPFLLYFIIKEYNLKNGMSWAGVALLTFFAVNGYFLLLNPGDFISSMLNNEFAPLIGIGYGFAQLSFLGILPVPRILFSITLFSVFALLVLLYIFKYRDVKYGLFAFPIIIFLFNYRLFSQYLFYWILISLLPFLDRVALNDTQEVRKPSSLNISQAKRKARILAVFVFGVLLVSSFAGYHYSVQNNPGKFDITSVKLMNVNQSGYSSNMVISMSLDSKTVNSSAVLFRIVTNGQVTNSNMYLWHPSSSNFTLLNGEVQSVNIVPDFSEYHVNENESFMVIAYYGQIQGSYLYTS